MSVDIVGSTAFKAGGYKKEKLPSSSSSAIRSSEWERFFIDFYQEFPSSFFASLSEFKNNVDIWKSLGDEIIFVAEPTSLKEAQRIIRKFADNICHFNDLYSKSSLRFKGTVWSANFPSPNAPVGSPKGRNFNRIEVIDFIGPSIDLGFRLSKHASPRKLVISAEACLLLLTVRYEDFELFFDGCSPLHGVLNGIGYPVIWIDTKPDRDRTAEDRLRGLSCKDADLRKYCEKFIDDITKQSGAAGFTPIYRPYLPGVEGFDTPPKDLDKKREMLSSLAYSFPSFPKNKASKMKSSDFKSNIKSRALKAHRGQ